ncbi:cyclic peptide export ABC transporter [Fulvivirgaceae bacterium PWU4]|uniref:Cyclic peptide export ABC transporter n=1 Tax=Chryseosolibacter histidini TaxID=2782349 RepID=A0AAP2DHS0_9BACT|nr:cyclic peptide export ABC transporter [Chryseosolibacter histidini]MBT1695447.1 cyclic peptide export ABC transporter [Chryseosolibacter histidini]
MKTRRIYAFIFLILGIFCVMPCSVAQQVTDEVLMRQIEKEVSRLMEKGDIPGLSLVMIRDGRQTIRNFGYADLRSQRRVTDTTLFELGSCSKAFTSLAVMVLVHQGKLALDDDVSLYIPWFRVYHESAPAKITIRNLLHHTSGIPWNTISEIPEDDTEDALERTVRTLEGQELSHLPGEKFEYATINYDVLALIVQRIAGKPFETFLQENVIDRLELRHTSIGYPVDSTLKATGYKIGFLQPREYVAPVFKGNNAAGYVSSNAADIGRWLRFQMGLADHELYELAQATHQRDETVPLHDMSSYAMGWDVSLNGNREIFHNGLNPNYTSFMVFRREQKLGVAVLANANSNFTLVIGDKVMKLLAGEKSSLTSDPGDGNDRLFSVASVMAGIYLLLVTAFASLMIVDIVKGRRRYEPFTLRKLKSLVLQLVAFLPFLVAIYLLPRAWAGFEWQAIVVWTPISFLTFVTLLLIAFGASYLTYAVSLFFPEPNKFKRIIPRVLLTSILSSLAYMTIIILITSALGSSTLPVYLVFYYVLSVSVYLLGRRFVEISLIRFTMELVYELRIKLIDKIFSTSYQKFEKMDRGRVYTAMNNDVSTVGESTSMFVVLITHCLTTVGALLYLASIAFWAALTTVLLISILATLYFLATRSTNKYYEQARDTQNVFMRLINGMIDGFKEISLHRQKKLEYKDDVAATAEEYRSKITVASVRFVNASLVGEILLIITLGAVAFAFPRIFSGIEVYTLMSFVIVLLYLIGPINTILTSVPGLVRLRIAWNRIQQFLSDIPANMDITRPQPIAMPPAVDSIKARGVKFQYKNGSEQDVFTVGPIDLEVRKGEILFIIGGNGSGKTTLAKLITGLYEPDEGEFLINNKTIRSAQLGEYFSTVFSPAFLFEKLYNIDPVQKSAAIEKYLQVLNLDSKVRVVGNRYSTIDLSGGQRKRLALLQCYLEESPIYLFDEWAADQDPDYRNFFYRTLLPEMKAMGKIVIAITHDDHYFDVADKILKMSQGQPEIYTRQHAHASPAAVIFP